MHVDLAHIPNDEEWMWVKQCTLRTVGLKAKTGPAEEWKHEILRARHSPIRDLWYRFEIEDVPYWVVMHLVRHHVGCHPFVMTQRTDRTGVDRGELPQGQLISMNWSLNAEGLMNVANKRLCMQASKETREVVRTMCDLVLEKCPEFENLLVPMCEWQGGVCHEMFSCGRCPG